MYVCIYIIAAFLICCCQAHETARRCCTGTHTFRVFNLSLLSVQSRCSPDDLWRPRTEQCFCLCSLLLLEVLSLAPIWLQRPDCGNGFGFCYVYVAGLPRHGDSMPKIAIVDVAHTHRYLFCFVIITASLYLVQCIHNRCNMPSLKKMIIPLSAQLPLSRLVVPILLAVGWIVGCALMVYIVFSWQK